MAYGMVQCYTEVHHIPIVNLGDILLDDSIPADYKVAHEGMSGYGNAVRRLEYRRRANLRLMSLFHFHSSSLFKSF